MVYRAYSYKIGRVVAMLDDEEWSSFKPLLTDMLRGLKDYRRRTGANLAEAEAKSQGVRTATQRYLELTGEPIGNYAHLWYVGMSGYGRLCSDCGKPFRTPRARMCAECGSELPEGEIAGPLNVPEAAE